MARSSGTGTIDSPGSRRGAPCEYPKCPTTRRDIDDDYTLEVDGMVQYSDVERLWVAVVDWQQIRELDIVGVSGLAGQQ